MAKSKNGSIEGSILDGRLVESRTVTRDIRDFFDWNTSLQESIARLQQVAQEAEDGETIRVDFTVEYGYYDDKEYKLTFKYSRLETEDEVRKRVEKWKEDQERRERKAAAAKAKIEEKEKALLKKLKKKYEE